jgi:HK97 family phage prohead protease
MISNGTTPNYPGTPPAAVWTPEPTGPVTPRPAAGDFEAQRRILKAELEELAEPDPAAIVANRHNLRAPIGEWIAPPGGKLPLARLFVLAAPWDEVAEGVQICFDAAECFKRGCFGRSIASGDEVNIDLDHKDETTFARRSREEVSLAEAPDGLVAWILIPDTKRGREALSLVQSNQVTGASVMFRRSTIRHYMTHFPDAVSNVIQAELLAVALVTTQPAYKKTRLIDLEVR